MTRLRPDIPERVWDATARKWVDVDSEPEVRFIDPPPRPCPADEQIVTALVGKTEAVRLLYESYFGAGSSKGLGWIPMLDAIHRRLRQVKTLGGL